MSETFAMSDTITMSRAGYRVFVGFRSPAAILNADEGQDR